MKKSKQHERNGGYSTASVQNIINLDITKPIDVETAANALEGHIKLYLNLLSKFEEWDGRMIIIQPLILPPFLSFLLQFNTYFNSHFVYSHLN